MIRMPGSVFAPYTSITTNILFFDKTGPTKETWFYRMDMPEGYKHFSKTKPMLPEHFDPVVEWWNNRTEIADTDTDTFKAKKYTAEEIAAGDYNLDLCGFPVEEKEILSPEETIKNYIEQKRLLERRLTLATDNLQSYLMGDQTVVLMNIKSISDRISILDNAFPGDMKAALLQAAMQGKLTEQLPEDGNAADLLEQIVKEKCQLIKEGKIKKEKSLPEITPNEVPFDIPENWKWVRWGNLAKSIQYGYNASGLQSGRIKMLRISDISANNTVIWDTVPFCNITETDIDSYLLHPNDILFARTGGTVGKSFLIKELPMPSVFAGYLIRTNYNSDLLSPQYLKYFMNSFLYWRQLQAGTTKTAQPNCNGQTLSKMIIPLPPLSEQKRIVEKLDKLLPLCDGLIEN